MTNNFQSLVVYICVGEQRLLLLYFNVKTLCASVCAVEHRALLSESVLLSRTPWEAEWNKIASMLYAPVLL